MNGKRLPPDAETLTFQGRLKTFQTAFALFHFLCFIHNRYSYPLFNTLLQTR